ncbi:oligopeptidase B [Deinobacterium chartae]|uniref:Oligopeptidase B n=1 Tax=Deinobacterium chartae TaxID=521158 RepID=A0A841HZB1_9DEIO|nr:S9 family peptidase [Deinobacterium chartae]MBB6098737.1 oligopeptidase B [Deinobacterium chartae]
MTRPTPPRAKQVPHTHHAHGDRRDDPYAWLRQRENPDVLAYLEAENAYLAAVMEPLRPLQEALYQDMLSHLQETDEQPPVRWGPYVYYTRTVAGEQYPLYCRRPRAGGPEQVLLDPNALKQQEALENLWVGAVQPSPDHRRYAYLLDIRGGERFELRVKDLESGEERRTGVTDVSGRSLAWSADGRCLYYIRNDETWRPHEVYRHRLGHAAESDALLYREEDPTFTLGLSVSDSGDELLLTSHSTVTTEVRHLPSADTEGGFRVILPRERGVEYAVEDGGDHWLMLSNAGGAREFKLLALPKAGGAAREVLPHDPGRKLDDLRVFRDHLLVAGRQDGLTRLWVLPRRTLEPRRLELPETVFTVRIGENHDFDVRVARVTYTSPLTPLTHFDLDLDTLELLEVKRTPVPNYDATAYRSERRWVTAADGTRVPVSLVYRQDVQFPAPTLLYGYGSYGASMDPAFDARRLTLLDRGWVYAVAHVRGGGELGRAWYEGGKLQAKPNSFSDFVDVAQALVEAGLTTPDRLTASGRSAGGLLMGAVLNLRPDLFRAVLAGVPFVDVVSTMLDASIPLTTLEYDEWGNPEDPAFYAVMKAYSPYDNVAARAYPHLWISTGLNDPRVAYWEPAKWAARLRERKTDRNVLLLKTLTGAGHFSSSGRYDALRETAEEYAFLIAAVEGRLEG